jgi:hypothetical protein
MSWMPAQEPILGDKRTCDALDVIIVPRVRDLGGGFSVHRALPATAAATERSSLMSAWIESIPS